MFELQFSLTTAGGGERKEPLPQFGCSSLDRLEHPSSSGGCIH
jgi:hypothetical protein